MKPCIMKVEELNIKSPFQLEAYLITIIKSTQILSCFVILWLLKEKEEQLFALLEKTAESFLKMVLILLRKTMSYQRLS